MTSIFSTPNPAQASADGAAATVPQDRTSWRAALVFMLVALLGAGLLYALAGTALARVLFPYQATGSIITIAGEARASALVAQPFAAAGYFHPRPSAVGYDPMSVAGSNLARSNPALRERIADVRARVAAREHIPPAQVPGDLVTASGSGIDPHISPAGARVQVARVAHARGLAERQVSALVQRIMAPATWGFLGAPRVNVVRLNLALDALSAAASGKEKRTPPSLEAQSRP